MRKQLVTSIDIEAPAEQVWEILVDFAAFPSWNAFIVQAKGRAEVGRQLTLRMQPVGDRLHWRGRLGVRGLFDAEHLFILEPLGASGTRLVQQEEFSGLLVRLFQRSLDRGTLPAFRAMNKALKDRAERATVARG